MGTLSVQEEQVFGNLMGEKGHLRAAGKGLPPSSLHAQSSEDLGPGVCLLNG